jgi:non-specific serine/threonine protein kinase/serine/threonine-protein kinase
MTPDWREIDDVFQMAVAVPSKERASFLSARCHGRPDIEREVLSLLDAYDASGGFLEPLAAETAIRPVALGPDTRIGPYQLTRLLGHGGMGTVYLGERVDGAFRHQVAIKLTRSALLDVEVARRFAVERQILASLRHPHIVTLFDGGATETGQAFLVMEYVEGEPIIAYARARRLSLADRLQLIRMVCAGVHAAHQHGVVHRDLKPANILVTAEGVPKVLDFGIAKLVDRAGADATMTTGISVPLTPNYASPEQLRGQPVTIASDVYSLGVLLYELVAGVRPYESEDQPLDSVLARVLDHPVTRPSQAAAACSDLPYDSSRLRGDLDAVVLKAMRVDPNDRYAAAGTLSDDITRVLAGQPVTAREPSFGYLARKLVARHRVTAAVVSLAIVGTLVALGTAIWQRQRAERERAAAQARFDDVRKLANTLIFKLDEAIRTKSPTEARSLVVTEALGYLDRLAATADDPVLRFELAEGYKRIGEVQGHPGFPNLGDRSAALVSFKRALTLVEPFDDHPTYRRQALATMVGAHRLMTPLQPDRVAARASAQAAVLAAERWVSIERTDESRRALAAAQFALAMNAGWPAGRPHWEAAGREFESLLAERPDDPDRMRNVALVDKYLTDRLASLGETSEAHRRAERAARLDGRRLELLPGNRQAMIDAALSYAQLAARMKTPAEQLALYEKSLGLREQVTAADPADQFGREVHRRALIQVASARLQVSDMEGARQSAERAVGLFRVEDPRLIDQDDIYWRARAYLMLGILDGRSKQYASGCRWLSAGAADAASLQAAGRRVPKEDLQLAREALPPCRPRS